MPPWALNEVGLYRYCNVNIAIPVPHGTTIATYIDKVECVHGTCVRTRVPVPVPLGSVIGNRPRYLVLSPFFHGPKQVRMSYACMSFM